MPDDYGIDDPTWEPFTVDGGMTFDHQRHGNAGILTVHGVVDMMEHLTEEAEAEVRHWMEEGCRDETAPDWLRAVLHRPPPPINVQADVNPAWHWRSGEYVIPVAGDWTLLSARGDRLRAVIVNQGANPALLSWTDDEPLSSGNGPWIVVPNGNLPGNPREIRAGGKIYAFSTLGTTLDIQEEYGMRDYEGGYQSP